MTTIVDLIAFEEGWREKPYLCLLGYPTVGFGFKIGPKGAPISQYQFTLPEEAGAAWLESILTKTRSEMMRRPRIVAAMNACDGPRQAVLISMAYQMGVDGLDAFKNTLHSISAGYWVLAAGEMLDSRWARQTPARAKRHAEQMRTGDWAKEYS